MRHRRAAVCAYGGGVAPSNAFGRAPLLAHAGNRARSPAHPSTCRLPIAQRPASPCRASRRRSICAAWRRPPAPDIRDWPRSMAGPFCPFGAMACGAILAVKRREIGDVSWAQNRIRRIARRVAAAAEQRSTAGQKCRCDRAHQCFSSSVGPGPRGQVLVHGWGPASARESIMPGASMPSRAANGSDWPVGMRSWRATTIPATTP